MPQELITSRRNPKVTAAAALLDAKARKKTGLFLLEGARLCADAAENGVRIQTLFLTPAAAESYAPYYRTVSAAAAETCFVDESVAEKLSDTASSQHFFCVCQKREADVPVDPNGFYVVTDRVQNPDNLGALSRSAEAFGASGLIVCGGCDVYSPKALRASMGALLRFPVLREETAADAVQKLKNLGMRVFAAVLSQRAADIRTVEYTGGAALVIGNEGQGVSPEAAGLCTDLVLIPMAGRAESLNAAAAGAVLIWELWGRKAD